MIDVHYLVCDGSSIRDVPFKASRNARTSTNLGKYKERAFHCLKCAVVKAFQKHHNPIYSSISYLRICHVPNAYLKVIELNRDVKLQ